MGLETWILLRPSLPTSLDCAAALQRIREVTLLFAGFFSVLERLAIRYEVLQDPSEMIAEMVEQMAGGL